MRRFLKLKNIRSSIKFKLFSLKNVITSHNKLIVLSDIIDLDKGYNIRQIEFVMLLHGDFHIRSVVEGVKLAGIKLIIVHSNLKNFKNVFFFMMTEKNERLKWRKVQKNLSLD